MKLCIPIDLLMESWPPAAHQHLREKYGPYYIMECQPCITSAPLCKPGKRRSRCGKPSGNPGHDRQCLAGRLEPDRCPVCQTTLGDGGDCPTCNPGAWE